MSAQRPTPAPVSKEEAEAFCAHCAFIYAVFHFASRVWRASNESDLRAMDSACPTFSRDIGNAIAEYAVLSACRVTDPAIDRAGNKNLTIEVFVRSAKSGSEVQKRLQELETKMAAFREIVKPVRDKLLAHGDRMTIQSGKPLAAATWEQWSEFWSTLKEFIEIASKEFTGSLYNIKIGGVSGDGDVIVRALREYSHR